MDFTLSEEQQLIQDSFSKALEGLVSLETVREVVENRTGQDLKAVSALTALGMPGLLVSETHGGSGLGLLEAILVSEELGRQAAPVPFVASSVMAVKVLEIGGSERQKQDWLPAVARGEKRLAVAFTEKTGGLRKEAGVQSSNGRLSGRATFALDIQGADAVLVSDQNGQVFIVPLTTEGVSIESFPSIDGTRAAGHIELDTAEGELLDGVSEAELTHVINAGRIAIAADSLGACETMLQKAVEYSLERKQFGRAIGSFQAVKHMCAEMAAELQPCRALIWHAAYAADHLTEEFNLSVLLAKSHMDEVSRLIAKSATEVFGGMGFADLPGMHFWYKRVGFNRAMLGAPERLRREAAALQGL